jgi:hypothetical protein
MLVGAEYADDDPSVGVSFVSSDPFHPSRLVDPSLNVRLSMYT